MLCFVLTTEEHLENRARAVYETWGRRCGKFLFITRFNSSSIKKNSDDKKLPIENVPKLPNELYSNLPGKVRQTLLYLNEHYPDYDWYLKADDDTFIIVENLLRFLISTIR